MVHGSQKSFTPLTLGGRITQYSNRHWTIVLLLIAVITFLLALFAFTPSLATWGDNAEFVILSQSILEGKGFKLINYPTPVPNKRYPPGFPLLLMPMILLFGTNIVLLKTTTVITYSISCIGIFFLLRQLTTTWIAFFTTLLIAFNYTLLNFSSQLMAEIPYLCFSVLTFCFYFSYEKAKPSKKKNGLFLCVTLCALYSFYIKTIGIALVGAILVSLLLKKKYKEAIIYMGLGIALYLPWLVRDLMVGSNTYLNQFFLVNPYAPSLGKLDWAHFGTRLTFNFSSYVHYLLPFIIWPSLAIKRMEYTTHTLFFLNIILFLSFFILEWRRKRYVIVMYLIFLLLILIAWPPEWTIPRMLIPIVPFIFVLYSIIINEVLAILKNKYSVGVSIMVLTIGFFFYSTTHWAYAKERQYGLENQYFATYYELCTWIKNNVEDDAIINTRKPYLAFLLSGKKTTRYSRTNPDQFYTLLKQHGVTHIIVSNLQLPGQGERSNVKLVNNKKNKFLLLHKTRNPTQYLFKILS